MNVGKKEKRLRGLTGPPGSIMEFGKKAEGFFRRLCLTAPGKLHTIRPASSLVAAHITVRFIHERLTSSLPKPHPITG
jgi:hypothetical protein